MMATTANTKSLLQYLDDYMTGKQSTVWVVAEAFSLTSEMRNSAILKFIMYQEFQLLLRDYVYFVRNGDDIIRIIVTFWIKGTPVEFLVDVQVETKILKTFNSKID